MSFPYLRSIPYLKIAGKVSKGEAQLTSTMATKITQENEKPPNSARHLPYTKKRKESKYNNKTLNVYSVNSILSREFFNLQRGEPTMYISIHLLPYATSNIHHQMRIHPLVYESLTPVRKFIKSPS